ncbi:MAG: helix-turn-helix transcriptional regulator, partial [Actinomycetota bacterium]|nr:helix-turn-helix transcriptional regulator [Actinomycetota bacterium]
MALTVGDHLTSGIPDLDELMGGLILGDNVVWVVDGADGADAVVRLEDALLAEAGKRRQPCMYVTGASDPAKLRSRLGPSITILDARSRSAYATIGPLEDAIVEAASGTPPGCIVIEGLERFARRWGAERAVAFFSRVCPRLFDIGALAYWRAPRRDLGRPFVEQITQVTQCVLEIGNGHLRVIKAEGRPRSVHGRLLRVSADEEGLRLKTDRALGRVARGLERLRQERNLSQTELARIVEVTPSAISQAEAGRRGLSLDTLLTLADRFGMGLDELLSAASVSGYILARRPRGPLTATSALLDDPGAGLRAYLVRLEG